ncbi:MAG: replicative DNA helicase [Kofleriaceae bacterium]
MSHARLERPREPPVVHGRVPPHNMDAEAAVLSAVLLDRDALDRVLEILKPEHFYSDAHGKIYEASQELALAGTPIDIISVASWLRDRERLQQVGGAAYLAQLADATPAVAHVGAHARVVYEKWRLRQLIATCQRVAAEGYGDVGEVQAFVDGAEASVTALARVRERSPIRRIDTMLHAALDRIDRRRAGDVAVGGVLTGYQRIDKKMGGWRDGNVYVIGARPGQGKTSLVLDITANVAAPRATADGHLQPGDGVVFFSLEMPHEQLVERALASEARVPFEFVRDGFLQDYHRSKLAEAASYLSGLPIWIDDTPGITLQELRAKVRRCQAEYDQEPVVEVDAQTGVETVTKPGRRIRMVVIDYLQLMRHPGAESQEQEVSAISKGLKELAKELQVVFVPLAQLNRAVETRPGKDKRPQLSDLRSSGGLEQDADAVLFIYRDEYYNPETTNARGIAELIIGKHRHGSTGKVLLRFDGSCMRFDNLADQELPDGYDEE